MLIPLSVLLIAVVLIAALYYRTNIQRNSNRTALRSNQSKRSGLNKDGPEVQPQLKNVEEVQIRVLGEHLFNESGVCTKCNRKYRHLKDSRTTECVPVHKSKYKFQTKTESSSASLRPRPTQQQRTLEYFDDIKPTTDGQCSDNSCPCSPSTRLRMGQGYLYISREAVEMRRDARTVKQLQTKCDRLVSELGNEALVFFDKPLITGVLVCEQGAQLRGLDLSTAAADARHWWETGQIPLRPTPLSATATKKSRI